MSLLNIDVSLDDFKDGYKVIVEVRLFKLLIKRKEVFFTTVLFG